MNYKQLLEKSPICFAQVDIDKGILYANPALCAFTGYSCNELKSKTFSEITHPEDIEKDVLEFERMLKGEINEYRLQKRYIQKSGKIVWGDLFVSLIPGEHHDAHFSIFASVIDITLKKKTEEELLKHKGKEEESSRLKSTFLAIISHELRTPLNPIIGFSSILKESSTDETVVEFATLINNSGNEMLKLIEDLFDLSFNKGQNIKCNYKPVLYIDLYSIALACLEEIIINSGKSDQIEIISSNCTKNINYIVEVDHAKILQVLSILFKNAVKFIHHGEIEFGSEISKDINTIRLFVRDTGIGIEEEKIKIIFNLFRQANDSYSRPYDGLGIGLAIAKQLVNIMGGTIEVESKVGKGSIFSFTIPVNIHLKEEISSSKNSIYEDDLSVFNGRTILIVDDNPFIHEIIKVQLRKFGIKFLTASNGLEAVRIVKNQVPDFILMDLVMPVMDGFEAITYIRALHPKLPISALTAHSLPKDRQRAIEVGCNEIITKPIHRDILLHILKKHFAKQNSPNFQG